MSPTVEGVFVWFPMACAVLFVGHYARRRLREGLSAWQVLTDRNFLIVFLYTGALLAIYLSCFYFFYLVPQTPAPTPGDSASRRRDYHCVRLVSVRQHLVRVAASYLGTRCSGNFGVECPEISGQEDV